MNEKQIERKSISDAQLRSELRKLFSQGVTQKSNAYEQIRTKFKMTKQRFWKMFNVVHSDWAKLKDKAESDGISEATKEAVKQGLKTDLELEMILCQIASGNVEVEEWIKGTPILRSVSPMEVINAAKVIFTKRGSNAPAKIAQTDKDGNDVSFLKLSLPKGINIELPSNTEGDD